MRILLVEDDGLLGKGVAAGLAQAGWAVDWVVDGLDAEAALRTGSYDAIVLDLGLPGIDGMTLLGRLRAAKDRTPVLVLTARDTLADRVAGLDAGGGDCARFCGGQRGLRARFCSTEGLRLTRPATRCLWMATR